MKNMKKLTEMVLVIVFSLTILTISASATSYSQNPQPRIDYLSDRVDWPSNVGRFDYISQSTTGKEKNGYTCLLQRFLGTYRLEYQDALDSNGNPDGFFGPTTERRTRDYQVMKGFNGRDVDGKVGEKTWRKIGGDLPFERKGPYTYFSNLRGDEKVMQVTEQPGYLLEYSYYYYVGGQYDIALFRR